MVVHEEKKANAGIICRTITDGLLRYPLVHTIYIDIFHINLQK